MTDGYRQVPRVEKYEQDTAFGDSALSHIFSQMYETEIENDEALAATMWSRMLFFSVSHDWEDLSFLRHCWERSIVVKGIQNAADGCRHNIE